MLILTALTALAFANPSLDADVSETQLECRKAATVADATGAPKVVGTLYRSCLQAEGAVEPDLAFNPWLPAAMDESLVLTDALVRMMADLADGCRQEAVYLDASGQPRVHAGEVRTCMADGGFAWTRPALAKRAYQGPRGEAVASAE